MGRTIMKKFTAIILSLVMVVGNSIVVWAADDTSPKTGVQPGENTNISIIGVYQSLPVSTCYSVDVSWGDMQFKYDEASVWNPDTHEYKSSSAYWKPRVDAGNVITITNHSNVEISVTLNYTKKIVSVEGAFKDASLEGNSKETLITPTAVGTTYANAPNDSAYLQLKGNPGEIFNTLEDKTLGTVIVTIN